MWANLKKLFIPIIGLIFYSLNAQTIMNVPADHSTIGAALNAASSGDTILVAPGFYQELIEIPSKSIVLASWFLTTEDTNYISQTILDGNGDSTAVIKIPNSVISLSTIMGFTIQNANDGIYPQAKSNIMNCHIINCSDGIDYESGSGGICKFNVFENNNDDGIDLDGRVDIIIENNIIRNNGDDGIEIRLHPYTGSTLSCIIRRNQIYGNHEDGIQLIDYNTLSDRFFLIERNLFYNNSMVGLGCMGNSNTVENYEGAGIPERIYLFNNTFVGNNYGVTGGDSLVSLNNIFVSHPGTAMKNVDGGSIVSHGICWDNGTDFENSNVDFPTILPADPLLDGEYHLQATSPGIDGGTSHFIWQGQTVLNLPSGSYNGTSPDLGAFEFGLTPPPSLRVISPNGGEVWQGGGIQSINWDSYGTSGTVRIECSIDNGSSWNDIFTSTFDDGTALWSVPYIGTSQALVRITDTDGDGPADQSDAVFTLSQIPTQTVRFANIGDYGDAGHGEQDVSELVKSWNVNFVFTNGDNNYPNGDIVTIDNNIGQYYRGYVDNYQGSYPGNDPPINGFFPSLGNHDWRTRAGTPEVPYPYLDYFALPGAGVSTTGTSGNERYYDFIIGPVHFFALDSDPHEPDGRTSTSIQGQWLQAQLTASTSRWKVVFMHHPPYSSSMNHGSEPDMQWPFEDWGADVVFAGHDHTYERIVKDDNNDGVAMPYFVNGLGGTSKYSFGTPVSGSHMRYWDDYGAMLVEASEDNMIFQFHARSGQLIDTYTIPGGPVLSVTSPNGGETWQAGSTHNITWSSFATSGNVRIEYSLDNGLSWTDIVTSTFDDGMESWSVPDNATIEALVRVSDGDGNGPAGQSDDVFRIIPASVSIVSLQDGVNGYSGTRDTWIEAANPEANHGNEATLYVDGNPDLASLLYWDLTFIPPESMIQSVDIQMNVRDPSSTPYEFYELKHTWVEGEATWNRYASGLYWENPGADGSEDRGSTVLGATAPSQPLGLNTIPLNSAGVAVVQSWVDNPSSNHGLIIVDYNNSNGADFSSREVGTVMQRPKLTVIYSPPPTVLVEVKIFLEGPYDATGDTMRTDLNDFIPTISPYSEDRRSVSSIPPDITDWALVELREAVTGPAIASRSVFLDKTGRIVADNGTTQQITMGAAEGSYYVVIKHRNHLAVMSAGSVPLSSSSSTLCDFTTSQSSAYTTGVDPMKDLGNGRFGMLSGDGNSDNGVDAIDYNTVWLPQNGTPWDYSKLGDFNIDGGIDAIDYNLHWLPNNGRASQVP